MSVVHDSGRVVLHHGDALDVLRGLPDNSVDAVVTDPPYGLAEHSRRNVEAALLAWLTGDREHVPDGRGFMGRDWDRFVPPPAVWDECFRVLKPGGHLLAFCAPRTYDLMAISIRLAGLTEDAAPQIRDSITWIMAQGFPKSLDVGKAIDKNAGVEREVLGHESRHMNRPVTAAWDRSARPREGFGMPGAEQPGGLFPVTAPATEDAARWDGWGTALKPASEPIVVARKPLAGTVAANVLTYGTGALNIDATRVEGVPPSVPQWSSAGSNNNWAADGRNGAMSTPHPAGRWPSNVVLVHGEGCVPVGTRKIAAAGWRGTDTAPRTGGVYGDDPRDRTGPHYGDEDGTETVEAWECVDGCPVAELNAQSGTSMSRSGGSRSRTSDAALAQRASTMFRSDAPAVDRGGHDDEGGAARFFATFRYQPKASRKERPRVLALAEWCACGHRADDHDDDGCRAEYGAADGIGPCDCESVHDTTTERRWIAHPTVKPLDLIRWLVRLVTPPGGTVLDPFAGTGTAGEACWLEGFRAVLIERDPESIPLILDRLTRRTDPVQHLTAKAGRGEDVDLGLFALLDPEEGAP